MCSCQRAPSAQTASYLMWEFLGSTSAQLVINLTALAVLIAIAYFVVQRFRDGTGEDQQSSHELLLKFRDLHHEGDIGEKEYRNIKTVLGDRVPDELSDNGEQG